MSAYCKDSGQFNTPFRLWETKTNDSISELIMAARGAAWIAKDIYHDMSKVPMWYRLTNFNSSATCMDISEDGNTALIGLINGVVLKIDGIRTTAIYDSANALVGNISVTQVFSSSRVINGVSFSKTNKDKAVICLGNYGNADYVYLSTNFTSANPVFNPVQGNLPKFPVYDAQINMDDSTMILVGTEKGVNISHNFLSGSPVYTAENAGMANIPVFMIRQYKNPSPWYKFEGPRFFIGTHGRGFFTTTTFARVGVNGKNGKEFGALTIYPNPARSESTISFNAMAPGKAGIDIYDLQGKVVLHEVISTTSGRNNYGFYVDGLANGNYISVVTHDGTRETAKLVVLK
jgi:hypothetical protein